MKIVVAGNYGASNLGDEMILQGILEMLKNVVPKAEITVLSSTPKKTAKRYGVKSEYKFPSGIRSLFKYIFNPKIKTRQVVKNCDYFILGGGGLFGNLKIRASIIWGTQALLALFYRRKVIMYGQSIGKLSTSICRRIVGKLFNKSELIVVRDKESQKRLKKIGVKNQIYVIPDMAFRTKMSKELDEDGEFKNNVIIALRQLSSATDTYKLEVADFVNWLTRMGWDVTFIDFQKNIEPDKTIHKEVISLVKSKEKIKHLTDIEEIPQLLKIFSQSRFVIGMRLHSIITAMKSCKPFVAISYNTKVQDFLKYANQNKYTIKLENISAESLKEKFEKLTSNEKQIKNRLNAYNQNSLKKHIEMEKTVRSILHK